MLALTVSGAGINSCHKDVCMHTRAFMYAQVLTHTQTHTDLHAQTQNAHSVAVILECMHRGERGESHISHRHSNCAGFKKEGRPFDLLGCSNSEEALFNVRQLCNIRSGE